MSNEKCQNHAKCGGYCEEENEIMSNMCPDCVDVEVEREREFSELQSLRHQQKIYQEEIIDLKRENYVLKSRIRAMEAIGPESLLNELYASRAIISSLNTHLTSCRRKLATCTMGDFREGV